MGQASHRLTQINRTGATAADALNANFTYDAYGRRIQTSIASGSQPPQTVQYLYEGAQALGEIRGGTLTHRLLTGLSLDETIARIAINTTGNKDAANSRIYLTDALNSVIAQLADEPAAAGTVTNSYGYSPYGEANTVGPDASGNPLPYTSRENDATGLNYYRAAKKGQVFRVAKSVQKLGRCLLHSTAQRLLALGAPAKHGFVARSENSPMFAPSQNDVRQFFCAAHAKWRSGMPMSALEIVAADWIGEHPEYHADLADVDVALAAVYAVDAGRTNPFLHLSMHLSISEQVSIDQPRGIKQAVGLLAARRASLHEAHHEVMECLGEMMWASQRSGLPPDGERYIASVAQRATRD